MISFLGEMQKNWLEKPSVEQNNNAFPKWLGRGIKTQLQFPVGFGDDTALLLEAERDTEFTDSKISQLNLFRHNIRDMPTKAPNLSLVTCESDANYISTEIGEHYDQLTVLC